MEDNVLSASAGNSDSNDLIEYAAEGPTFHQNFIDTHGIGEVVEPDEAEAFLNQEIEDETQPTTEQQLKFNIHSNACFNDNYLVFSLKNIKLPQITDIYIDKEEDMLDC